MLKKHYRLFLFFTIIFVGCTSNALKKDSPTPNEVIPFKPLTLKQKIDVKPLTLEQKIDVFNSKRDNYVMVVAHRGDWQNYPENSLEAIQNAIKLGADIVEIDIRVSLDNHLVLMHDKMLDRTTNGSGKVSHHTLNELKKLNLKDKDGNITSAKIPTLEEALVTMKGKILFLIDKSKEHIPQVLQLLDKTGTIHQSLFLFFDPIKNISKLFGNNMSRVNYIPGIHHTTQNINAYVTDFEDTVDAYAFWIKNESNVVHQKLVEMRHSLTQNFWINTTHEYQCAKHTDYISLSNPNSGWGWCINQGITIIMTDYPKELIAYLESTSKRMFKQ